jgi:hypothetical protein
VATSTAHRLQTSRLELLRTAGLPAPTRSSPPLAQKKARPATRTTTERCFHGLALIATRNFLPFAKLTAQTFLAHHPDFTVFLLLVDGTPSDMELFNEGRVILLPELELRNAGWYSAKFTAPEFSNALKPAFLKHLTALTESVIYLDCDTAVFSRLTEAQGIAGVLRKMSLSSAIRRRRRPPSPPFRKWVVNRCCYSTVCSGVGAGTSSQRRRCATGLRTLPQVNFGY